MIAVPFSFYFYVIIKLSEDSVLFLLKPFGLSPPLFSVFGIIIWFLFFQIYSDILSSIVPSVCSGNNIYEMELSTCWVLSSILFEGAIPLLRANACNDLILFGDLVPLHHRGFITAHFNIFCFYPAVHCAEMRFSSVVIL